MTLPEVKDYFSQYLGEDKVIVRDSERYTPTNPFNQALTQRYDINTPHDGEHIYLSADGETIAIVRRYNVRDDNGDIITDNKSDE